MTESRYDVIVVGVGAMGASACYQLARRGLRVLGLEQFSIAHDRGSSHGQSRMIRMAYYEHPDYVPLLRRAYELWEQLEIAAGVPLLYKTGGVYLGPPAGGLVAGSISSARLHGLSHEILTPGELHQRFPQFRIPDDWQAVYEPMAGFLRPEAAVSAFVRLARSAGAEIREFSAVLDWESNSAGVTVKLRGETVKADRLILAGGAWSAELIRDLGVPLVVTRQVMGWIRPMDVSPFELGRFPVWAAENPDGSLLYGFPAMPGEATAKVAWHGAGSPTEPHSVDRQTNGSDAATILPALPHLLPDLVRQPADPQSASPMAEMKVCLYTNSPDHHFIIDRLPGEPRVVVACGFSGHGFKFASVVGEILADLSTSGATLLPASFLGLGRFGLG